MIARAVIDERSLDEFRRRHLAPEAILAAVERHVAVLYRLPVGVGKSFAVDERPTRRAIVTDRSWQSAMRQPHTRVYGSESALFLP